MTRRLAAALVLVIASAACRSAGPVTTPGPPSAAPAPALAPTSAMKVAEPTAIRWARGSAEHRALFLQVFRQAAAYVEREAAKRVAGSWAVVLDADETVIDNSTYQLEQARLGRPFEPETWSAWVKRRQATPLPGAAAFLERVRALGGRIAIVTNRSAAECPDTEAVFKAQALAYDVMLCKQGPSDKNPRFEALARGAAGLPPLEVVAFLGDNVNDFPGQSQAIRTQGDGAFAEFGARFFVVPNAMYGSWESN